MQDIVQKLISDKAAGWQTMLKDKLGFGSSQAQNFVQGLVEQTIGAVSSGKLDLGSLTKGIDASQLMKKIDLNEIAAKAGLDDTKAKQGLEALAPELSSALSKVGDSEGLTKGLMGKASGLLGGAADPVSKLFGK